jgi:uncharacterized membrane protein YkoI
VHIHLETNPKREKEKKMPRSVDFAQEGEEFITNSVIWPKETKEEVENRMRKRYDDFSLRFDYKHLVYNFELVTSEDFGYMSSDINTPRGEAIGVAVYGKKCKDSNVDP